jgi:hypothetical protein
VSSGRVGRNGAGDGIECINYDAISQRIISRPIC